LETIWITGGKGFIGRHLASFLAKQRNKAYGVGHGLWAEEDSARASYRYWCNGEIEASNLSLLQTISGRPDTIFHLAGGSSVVASLQRPREDFSRTVESTSRLLEWVRQNSLNSRVVAVSSAAVYGRSDLGSLREDVCVAPSSPYGHHKAMMENLCSMYCKNYGLQIAVVRLFSIYGQGLKKQLLWDICCKLDANKIKGPTLEGTGHEVRDWLHVSDAVRLLWMARELCGENCKILNGGTGKGTTVAEIAEIVCRTWGVKFRAEFSGVARKGDPERLVANIACAAKLGFEPTVMLEDGILEMTQWFRGNQRSLSNLLEPPEVMP
jgi:UDP-glucose 4-epimerase